LVKLTYYIKANVSQQPAALDSPSDYDQVRWSITQVIWIVNLVGSKL